MSFVAHYIEGGGAKNINFQELAADLAQITFDYPFRIPPYFALIIRAIGVLEARGRRRCRSNTIWVYWQSLRPK